MLQMLNVGIMLDGDAARPQFVEDLLRLGNDATGWLIAISAVAAVVLLIIEGMKWYSADENEQKVHLKKIKRIFVGAVLIVSVEALVAFVLSYFIH